MEKKEAEFFTAKGNLNRSGVKLEDLNWETAKVLGFSREGFDKIKGIPSIREVYEDIKGIIRFYLDISERYVTLISLWIIGTYFHKSFESYPFLYINAMRGSGKTRLCKLISNLCWNGSLTNNISEAVLFRTASQHTILIDECEQIGGKEKNTLRELLQGAYKRGSQVKRMRKNKEAQEVESFDLYTPVVMANIWGMENVLGDRCITIILEKSTSKIITTLIEDFAENEHFKACRDSLEKFSVGVCNIFPLKNIKEKWNKYIYTLYNTTHTYIKLHTNIEEITSKEEQFFDKIRTTDIDGRHLELFFPLFIIAKGVGDDILDEILTISKEKVVERKEDEYAESRDVTLIDFISKLPSTLEWKSVMSLTREFKNFVEDDTAIEWLNSTWVGKALKRLSLVLKRRRLAKGIEVIVNVAKAQERIKMFKGEHS